MDENLKISENELRAWLVLSSAPGLGLKDAVALLREYGGPEGVLEAGPHRLQSRLSPEQARQVAGPMDEQRQRSVEQALEWTSRVSGAFAVTLADSDYPRGLLQLSSPPFVLFGLGRRELLRSRFISIFGSQRPSPSGARTAREFGAGLGHADLALASAMMEGVDAESLKGALSEGGDAAVVCATPLNRVYPPQCRDLMAEAARRGLVLGFLMPGAQFSEANLRARYYLLVALSQAVVIMEAGAMSKAVGMAKIAADLGRDVLAVPGDIHSPHSKGPNHLIRNGATLVESVQDIANEINRLSDPRVRLSDWRG